MASKKTSSTKQTTLPNEELFHQPDFLNEEQIAMPPTNLGYSTTASETDEDEMTLEELSQMAASHVGMTIRSKGTPETNKSIVVEHVEIGKSYFAFTNTFGFIGTIIARDEFGIHLSDTVWVAHAGFMTKMAATGKLNVAVPMLAKSFIPWANITNLMEWNFPVPTEAVDE